MSGGSAMDPAHMRAFIGGFSLAGGRLGSQGYERVLLQLFGFTGHGKSAFINSCKYLLEGQYQEHAALGSYLSPETTIRTSYRLTDTVTLVDNRGLRTANCHENALIYAQLGNLMYLDRNVFWPKNYVEIMRWIEDADNDPNYSDFVVPVFIYKVLMSATEGDISEIKEILKNAEKLTGIKPFVVLTHKDGGQLTKVKNMFTDMGIDNIFQLENYTLERHERRCATDDQILMFLYKVLREVTTFMETQRDPKQDRRESKKFVLEFAHEKEMENARERAREEGTNARPPKRGCPIF